MEALKHVSRCSPYFTPQHRVHSVITKHRPGSAACDGVLRKAYRPATLLITVLANRHGAASSEGACSSAPPCPLLQLGDARMV